MLILLGLVSLAATIIGPRRLWWSLHAWSYRNPEANEPSDSAFGIERFVLAVIAVVALAVGAATVGDPAPGSPEAQAAELASWEKESLCTLIMNRLEDAQVQTDDRDKTRDRANAVLAEFNGKVDGIRGDHVVDFSLDNGMSGTYGSGISYDDGC